jgi:HlyD family secretion protein
MRRLLSALTIATLSACAKAKAPAASVYQAIAVERRDIIVSARANGTIQPDTTVEVKSQASGEVLQVKVETGEIVKAGALMVRIDPRIPKNNVDQAQSNLEVAQAKLENAKTQLGRSEALFKSQSITQTEYDQSALDYATAKAGVVSARVNLQNAQITLDQTDVRAPSTGTIIELDVERGQVISSPISTVGGGTVLLKMADLNLVQVSALVDETDIGKIQSGLRTTVTVDAFPNRQFDGRVLKIEPQATVSQNVTMFPVLIRIDNHEGLLRPGMNTEVQIHVGRRDSVLAVPNTALRTQKDMASAADVLGLSLADVQAQLAQAGPAPSDSAKSQPVAAPAGVNSVTLPNGRVVPLPAGVTEQQVQAALRKRMSGQEPTADERALLRKVFQAGGGLGAGGGGEGGGGGDRARQGSDPRFGGRFVVFVRRQGQPLAVNVTTGLTDLDYSEVLSGLTESDSVLILPSASLVQSQKEMTQRMQRVTGGGGIPGMNAQAPSGGKAPAAAPPAATPPAPAAPARP